MYRAGFLAKHTYFVSAVATQQGKRFGGMIDKQKNGAVPAPRLVSDVVVGTKNTCLRLSSTESYCNALFCSPPRLPGQNIRRSLDAV